MIVRIPKWLRVFILGPRRCRREIAFWEWRASDWEDSEWFARIMAARTGDPGWAGMAEQARRHAQDCRELASRYQIGEA